MTYFRLVPENTVVGIFSMYCFKLECDKNMNVPVLRSTG